jgi:hypothetical protein
MRERGNSERAFGSEAVNRAGECEFELSRGGNRA